MNTINMLVENLKSRGNRMTTIRRKLVNLLSQSKKPLSAKDLCQQLQASGNGANKTTVYRQLGKLIRYGLLREVRLDDRAIYYELAMDNDHHHHLVCVRCHTIEDIGFADDLKKQERIIAASKRFKTLRHSLEFFGLCHNCQRKAKK